MEDIFTPEFCAAFTLAATRAREYRHEFLTLEHLLYALLSEQRAVEILEACGADLDSLKNRADEVLLTFEHLPGDVDYEPVQTLSLRRVLQRAAHQGHQLLQKADGGNVLVAMFSEPQAPAVRVLSEHGITLAHVLPLETAKLKHDALAPTGPVAVPLPNRYRAIVVDSVASTNPAFFLEENVPDSLGTDSWRVVPVSSWPMTEDAYTRLIVQSPIYVVEMQRRYSAQRAAEEVMLLQRMDPNTHRGMH